VIQSGKDLLKDPNVKDPAQTEVFRVDAENQDQVQEVQVRAMSDDM
jgi:hypothetical protein